MMCLWSTEWAIFLCLKSPIERLGAMNNAVAMGMYTPYIALCRILFLGHYFIAFKMCKIVGLCICG